MNMENHAIPEPDSFSNPYFFFSNNSKAELLYVSPSVEQVLGYRPSQVIGRRYTDFLDSRSPLNADVATCRRRRFEGCANHERLRVVESRDRQLKVLKVQTYGKLDASGRVVANHGIAQDVTDLYFAEEEMHKRLSQLRSVDRQLSDRERFVLERVVKGTLNKVIARELDLSERSVEKIRSRLVEKFKAQTMSEVVARATELKMLTDVLLLAHDSCEEPVEQCLNGREKIYR